MNNGSSLERVMTSRAAVPTSNSYTSSSLSFAPSTDHHSNTVPSVSVTSHETTQGKDLMPTMANANLLIQPSHKMDSSMARLLPPVLPQATSGTTDMIPPHVLSLTNASPDQCRPPELFTMIPNTSTVPVNNTVLVEAAKTTDGMLLSNFEKQQILETFAKFNNNNRVNNDNSSIISNSMVAMPEMVTKINNNLSVSGDEPVVPVVVERVQYATVENHGKSYTEPQAPLHSVYYTGNTPTNLVDNKAVIQYTDLPRTVQNEMKLTNSNSECVDRNQVVYIQITDGNDHENVNGSNTPKHVDAEPLPHPTSTGHTELTVYKDSTSKGNNLGHTATENDAIKSNEFHTVPANMPKVVVVPAQPQYYPEVFINDVNGSPKCTIDNIENQVTVVSESKSDVNPYQNTQLWKQVITESRERESSEICSDITPHIENPDDVEDTATSAEKSQIGSVLYVLCCCWWWWYWFCFRYVISR